MVIRGRKPSRIEVSLEVLAILTASLASAAAFSQSPDSEKVSKPFEYSGYTSPEYTSFKTSSEYVMMADGERLAVDIHLPAEGPERTSFPVILEYTPYQRSTIDPVTGKISDATDTSQGKFFLSYGYALVVADMRGTGASTGWMMDFMPRLSKDGAQLVEWIARQPWCDGNIGMTGSSYLGWSQMAVASRAPRALKCIVPECIPLDGYTGEAYPGGIFLESFLQSFSEYMKLINQNYYVPDKGIRPAKPALDEDKDGDLKDEIPIDTNGDGTFLDDGVVPKYADDSKRIGFYYIASMQHQKGDYDYLEWASTRGFIDAATPLNYTMYDLSPSAYVPGVMQSRLPLYHIGGWFDAFTRGSFELYCTMAKATTSKLIVAPSYHDFGSGPFWKHFGFTAEQVEKMYLIEHLRFYDRCLKGIKNGIAVEPPIYLYVMNGGGWRFEKEWPLARQVKTKFYLGGGQSLAAARTEDGRDEYKADFTHDGRYTESLGNRYVGIGGQVPKTPPTRTDKDKQCLVYTSAPLDADTEVTGHPIVHWWISSTADDGDFFFYLEDVDDKGEAALVTEGQLRAGFAELYDNNAMIRGGKFKIEVLPKLPWHGFQKDQYKPKIFADGARVEITVDLNPTSWVFKQGHRIRVTMACADYPTFQLHPTLSPKNKPDAPDNIIPTVTVYREASFPSSIELPVIPPDAPKQP